MIVLSALVMPVYVVRETCAKAMYATSEHDFRTATQACDASYPHPSSTQICKDSASVESRVLTWA